MRGAGPGQGVPGRVCRAGLPTDSFSSPQPPLSAGRTPGVVFMFPETFFLSAGTNCLGNDIPDGRALPVSAGEGRGWVKRQMPELV